MNRREFLKTTTVGVAGFIFAPTTIRSAISNPNSDEEKLEQILNKAWAAFVEYKNEYQFFDFDKMITYCRAIAGIPLGSPEHEWYTQTRKRAIIQQDISSNTRRFIVEKIESIS